MSGYIAPVEVYYVKGSESPSSASRIAPAPTINISPEIYYANDNVIGYTYNITLNGYANALRKENDAGSTTTGLDNTLQHIADIRDIFNFNGGDLYIKYGNGGSNIIVAKGATIKSINFNNSDNRWVNYAPFSIEIEFNEIDLTGCSSNSSIACSGSIFHQVVNAKNINNKLIDIQAYKIKEFNDKWTFTIDDKIYNSYDNILNDSFSVSYTISAVGKNYYIDDNLIPAWQQAKLFVQDRLRKQINGLIDGSLQIENSNMDGCGSTKDLTQIHDVSSAGTSGTGIASGFDTLKNGSLRYDVYNEYISCDTSESEGSFSLTYNALIKRGTSSNPAANAAIHSYTNDYSTNNQPELDATITVKGTIQGLVRGGFIYYDFNDFQLPNNGSFITAKDGVETKYGNALAHYTTLVGNKSDLFNFFKEKLNVKKSQLLIKGTDDYPRPSSFSLEHNYLEGSISYTATYNRKNTIARDRGYTNISIVRKDPVEAIQEFIVPGRSSGPIIQRLNCKTARTISINIDGASQDNKRCSIDDICSSLPLHNINGLYALLQEREDVIKTREDYTSNQVDGSFSISLEYISRG